MLPSLGTMRTTASSLAAVTLLGVACAYEANSFKDHTQFPAERQTAGCLDVGVGAHHASREFAPVVRISLGNRCDDPVRADLSAMVAWGMTRAGERIALMARDPEHVLRPRELAAAWSVTEGIEFKPLEGDRISVAELCVDLSGVARGLTSKCFASEL